VSRADVAARSLTDQLDPTDLPVDPEEIAHGLGVQVLRQPMDARLSGMLLRRDDQITVGLNSDRPIESQRFTLAHLLGHQQIHARRKLILDGIARHAHSRLASMPTDREEMEANRYAGALLMPETTVRRLAAEADFATARDLTERLAAAFEVGFTVMAYRLITLGIAMDI
jgi:Zn-dependent peptidase ImmA (M78 family)